MAEDISTAAGRRANSEARQAERYGFNEGSESFPDDDKDIEALLRLCVEESAPEMEAQLFEDAGVMTNNRGLVLRDPASGAEWQLTIARSA